MKTKSSAVLVLALATWLGGCASPPSISPEMAARDTALSEKVQTVKKQQAQFLVDAEALAKDVRTFQAQPGWNELAPILKNSQKTPNQAAALKAWGERWKQPSDTTVQRYQQLVERSSATEKQRKELLATWVEIKATERELFRSSGRFHARELDTAVGHQTLNYEVNKVALTRYGLDELGLFRDLLPAPEPPPGAATH